MTRPRTRTTLLMILILTVAIQAGAITAQAAGPRPPTRIRVISCVAAGYPAGWGSPTSCTVYRPYTSRRAPAPYRLTPR